MHSLSGLVFLVTRPAHQSAHLQHEIEKCGGQTILLPTIEISYISSTVLHDAISKLSSCQIAIFTSANAVLGVLPHHTKNTSTTNKPKIIAIGTGTANALKQFNLHADFLPEEFNSEGILKLPILQNVARTKIAIFTGENSRPLLRETLQQRGALVAEIVCYRRQKAHIDPGHLSSLASKNINLIICSSPESLKNLYELCGAEQKNWVCSIPILIGSSKAVALAKELGWQTIIAAEDSSDDKFLEKIKYLFSARP